MEMNDDDDGQIEIDRCLDLSLSPLMKCLWTCVAALEPRSSVTSSLLSAGRPDDDEAAVASGDERRIKRTSDFMNHLLLH